MTNEELIKLLEERGDKVYIIDRGLMRFGKFVIALFGLFVITGVFFFGFDLKKAAEEATQARLETEKTMNELNETRDKLVTENSELEKTKSQFLESIAAAKERMRSELEDAAESARRMLGYEQEISVVRLRVIQSGGATGPDPALVQLRVDQSAGAVSPLAGATFAPAGTTIHLALVSQVGALKAGDLNRVAAALQKQIQVGLKPTWNVDATIESFDKLENVPAGYWPIIVKGETDLPAGAGAFHTQKDGHPLAVVGYDADVDLWTLAASQEMLEMLVDPAGNRLKLCRSPNPADGDKVVNVLVEISQPVEGIEHSYRIDGVVVSDFVTPSFYDATVKSGIKYSYTGAAVDPLKILKAGYISWIDPVSKEWYQQIWFDGDKPDVRSLGKIDG
jgi:hypothetical protein